MSAYLNLSVVFNFPCQIPTCIYNTLFELLGTDDELHYNVCQSGPCSWPTVVGTRLPQGRTLGDLYSVHMLCALGHTHSDGFLQEISTLLCVSAQIAVSQDNRVQLTKSRHCKECKCRPVEQCQSQEFIIALTNMCKVCLL